MRTLTCLLMLTVVACVAPSANDEEPLIEPKPVQLSPREEAFRARQEERAAKRAAGPVEKVVAMPLSSKALDAETVGSLDRLLVSRLATDGTYDVISPADISSLLGVERLKDAAGCNDVTCAADFAGALDARFVLYGVIDELGGRLNITLNLVDARDARVHARSQVTVDKDERVYDLAVDAAVAHLLGDTSSPTSITASAAPAGPNAAPVKLHESVVGPIFVDIPERFNDGAATVERTARDAESIIIAQWIGVGFEALDRMAVGEASLDRLREMGALYWIVGDASSSDNGTIMGTRMHSFRANVSVRIIDVKSGKVVATAKDSGSVGHMDRDSGVQTAIDKATRKCSIELLQQLVVHLGNSSQG